MMIFLRGQLKSYICFSENSVNNGKIIGLKYLLDVELSVYDLLVLGEA